MWVNAGIMLVLLLHHFHFLVPQTGNLNTHLLPPNSPPPTRLEGLVHRGLPNTPRDLFKQTEDIVYVLSAVQVWLRSLGSGYSAGLQKLLVGLLLAERPDPVKRTPSKIREGATLQAQVSRNPGAVLEERQC